MALVKSSLKSSIQSFLGADADSADDFTVSLFDSYESYANAAADISLDNPTGFPAKSSAAQLLAPAMKAVNANGVTNSAAAQQLGTALGKALEVFWTGVTFGITMPTDPMISEIAALVSLPGVSSAAAITTLEPTEDRSVAAGVWADAMDAFTKTVEVTITGMMPGPSGPVPAEPITATIT
jgi:hypothetical protein